MSRLYNIAQANYKQARYLRAQQRLLNIDSSDSDYIKSRTLLLRCFLEQGKIGEAASLVNKLNKELFVYSAPDAPLEDVTELRLWCSAARLYSTQNWSEHINFCDEVISAGTSPKQIALAADLKLTGEIFSAILTGRIAPKRNREIFEKFEKVADFYNKLSLTEEYLWAKFKRAGFGFNKEEHLRREARRIFTQ